MTAYTSSRDDASNREQSRNVDFGDKLDFHQDGMFDFYLGLPPCLRSGLSQSVDQSGYTKIWLLLSNSPLLLEICCAHGQKSLDTEVDISVYHRKY